MTDSQFNKPRMSKGHGPLLGLAMIVKDGGQLFAELMEEAEPWVDEIIVGDTGSSDQSISAATAQGARVLDVPWTNDFSAARNTVLEHCTARWILILDADEKIAPQGWQEIRQWVQERTVQSQQVAARLETRNYLPGRHGKRGWRMVPDPDPQALPNGPPSQGYSPSLKIRLFPNFMDIRFTGILHETVEAAVVDNNIPAVDLQVAIHHFGMLNEDLAKNQRYLALSRAKTAAEPHCAIAWSEQSDCATACGLYSDALEALDRALILEPGNISRRLAAGWLLKMTGQLDQADLQLNAVAGSAGVTDDQLAEACHLRAQVAMQKGCSERVPHLLGVALRLTPENGHLLNTLGAWHLSEGRAEAAETALTKAVVLLPDQEGPLLNLALLFEAAGNPTEALKFVRQALVMSPKSARARQIQTRINEAIAI